MAAQPRTAFVISPFEEPYNSYWTELFRPALAGVGLSPKRGDSMFRAGNVVRQIWELISESVVVLAEVSEQNANVYYELGLAHAIGKPCVLLTRDASSIPFDLRSQRHIVYDTQRVRWSDELLADIARSVEETLAAPELSTVFPQHVPGLVDDDQSVTTAHLRMLQASVDSLRRQLEPAALPGYQADRGLGTADELRTLAEDLIASGSGSESVVEALRARGAPHVWASEIVRELGAGGGRHG
jgi:hypothetical protein